MNEVLKNRWHAVGLYLEVATLYFTIVLLKSPVGISSALLVFALVVLYRHRKEFRLSQDLKQVFYLFLAYIVTFTLISDYPQDSVKGLYDIVRSLFLFWIGFLFLDLVEKHELNTFFLIVTALILASHFLFPQRNGMHFGFHMNQNNVSVQVFLTMAVGLGLVRRQALSLMLGAVILSLGLALLLIANTRGILLGIFIASVVLVNMHFHATKRVLLAQAAMIGIFIVYVFMINDDFSLSNRDEIWQALINFTLDEHALLGTGLNTIKPVLASISVRYLTAHNLFLEIFASSGLIGLTFFCFILYRLVRFYLRQEFRQSFAHTIALFALIVFFVEFQFDLKFTAFSFMGIMFGLFGMVYHESVTRPQIIRKNQQSDS
jgi:O-antigen ligase